MKDAPPDRDEEEDVDARYRRVSALDTSRPSDAVRSAVLAHAARLAGERAASAAGRPVFPQARPSPSWRGRPWAPLLGSLAVAGLAALLITPHYLSHAPHRELAAQSAHRAPPPMAAMSPVAAPSPPAAPSERQLSEHHADRPPPGPPEPQQALAQLNKAPQSNAAAPAPPAASDQAADLDTKLAGAGSIGGSAAASNAPSPAPSVATSAAGRGAALARAQSSVLPESEPDALLRRAAETGDLAALQAALATHADLESRDARGRTALMLATVRGQRAVVELLLARGANPDARDAAGVSPLEAATAAHQEAIAAALRQAGGH